MFGLRNAKNRLQGLAEQSQTMPQESGELPSPITNGMEYGKGLDGAIYGGGIRNMPTNRLNSIMQDNSYGIPVSGQPYGQDAAYGPMVINPNYNGIPDEYKSPFYSQPSDRITTAIPTAIPTASPERKSRSLGNRLENLAKQSPTVKVGKAIAKQVNKIPIVEIAKKAPVYKAVKKLGKKLGF